MTAGTARARFVTFRGFRLAQRAVLRSGNADLSRLACRALPSSAEGAMCGARATWMLTAACGHEHVVPSLACDAHAEDSRTRRITCTECAGSRVLAHRCPVTIEYVPLDGGKGRQ